MEPRLTKAELLIGAARSEFGIEPSIHEMRLLREAAGDPVDRTVQEAGDRATVRAEVLRWLAIDPEAAKFIDPKGICVRDADIAVVLDFALCRVTTPWAFVNCVFCQNVLLHYAQTASLTFVSCVANKEVSGQCMTIDGHLSLHAGPGTAFRCVGKMSLRGATIKGDFDACGAQFESLDVGLELSQSIIFGNAYLRRGFASQGLIMMNSCDIEGDLSFSEATINALICNGSRVGGKFIWTKVKSAARADFFLVGSSLGTLIDDEASWPQEGRLRVDRLIYADLISQDTEEHHKSFVKHRIRWLNLQPAKMRMEPQPWLQLAQLARAKGNKTGAREVLFNLRKNQSDQFEGRFGLSKLLFAQLEEQPLRILIPIALLVSFGFAIVRNAEHGEMAPTNKDAYASWSTRGSFDMAYPRFNPVVYAPENALPLIKLGQDDKWAPNPNCDGFYLITSYGFLNGVRWFLIISGWVQGTVLAAAIGGRFKSE